MEQNTDLFAPLPDARVRSSVYFSGSDYLHLWKISVGGLSVGVMSFDRNGKHFVMDILRKVFFVDGPVNKSLEINRIVNHEILDGQNLIACDMLFLAACIHDKSDDMRTTKMAERYRMAGTVVISIIMDADSDSRVQNFSLSQCSNAVFLLPPGQENAFAYIYETIAYPVLIDGFVCTDFADIECTMKGAIGPSVVRAISFNDRDAFDSLLVRELSQVLYSNGVRLYPVGIIVTINSYEFPGFRMRDYYRFAAVIKGKFKDVDITIVIAAPVVKKYSKSGFQINIALFGLSDQPQQLEYNATEFTLGLT